MKIIKKMQEKNRKKLKSHSKSQFGMDIINLCVDLKQFSLFQTLRKYNL